MYDTITKYNDHNYTLLSNVKIREAIDQVMREEESEANKGMVDTFSTQRNVSEDLINKVSNLTINNMGNNITNKVADFKIKNVGNYLINKVKT